MLLLGRYVEKVGIGGTVGKPQRKRPLGICKRGQEGMLQFVFDKQYVKESRGFKWFGTVSR